MKIENLQLATAAVALMAVLILLQGLALTLVFVKINKQLGRLDRRLELLFAKVKRTTRLSHKLAEQLKILPELASDLKGGLLLVSETALKAVRALDARATDGTRAARSLLKRTDGAVNLALNRFSQQTFRIHRLLVDPALRASTVVRSVLQTVSRLLLRREPSSPADYLPEDEAFV